jgi:hypothetical protein
METQNNAERLKELDNEAERRAECSQKQERRAGRIIEEQEYEELHRNLQEQMSMQRRRQNGKEWRDSSSKKATKQAEEQDRSPERRRRRREPTPPSPLQLLPTLPPPAPFVGSTRACEIAELIYTEENSRWIPKEEIYTLKWRGRDEKFNKKVDRICRLPRYRTTQEERKLIEDWNQLKALRKKKSWAEIKENGEKERLKETIRDHEKTLQILET